MSLIDMIEQAAGSGALQQIGARVGLSPQELQSAIGGLAPVLESRLAQHAATGQVAGTLPGGVAPQPGTDEAEEHGTSVLGTILGSKDASRAAAADASQQTGIGVDKLKALLPQLASVAATAMGQQGGLGGLLGGLGRV